MFRNRTRSCVWDAPGSSYVYTACRCGSGRFLWRWGSDGDASGGAASLRGSRGARGLEHGEWAGVVGRGGNINYNQNTEITRNNITKNSNNNKTTETAITKMEPLQQHQPGQQQLQQREPA